VAFTAGVKTTLTDASGNTVNVLVGEGITAAGAEGITAVNNALVFQIGANQNQTVKIGLDSASIGQLGRNVTNSSNFASLSEIDASTSSGAQSTLALIDNAITKISTMRSSLGSFQSNTLESNLNNLRIASENMTAAESTLRDTDFAAEMAEFTKNQILVQAGMTVLSNAAQIPQSVMTLLR
ncbi:MAG TPA: flagellin, partial [Planctomycetota bacterium]|nr:flagellin [Planctomycetota bacterium]